MKFFAILLAFTAGTWMPPPIRVPAPPIPWSQPAELVQGCCKTCSKGKACGDSCISRKKQCHKGKGCACDG